MANNKHELPLIDPRAIRNRCTDSRATLNRGYYFPKTPAEYIVSGPISKKATRYPPGLKSEPSIRLLKGWSGLYFFPVCGKYRRPIDSWDARRSRGRPHHGVDIVANEGTDVCAITDGYIARVANWRGAGLTISLAANDGRGYEYMHLQDFHPDLKLYLTPPQYRPGKYWTVRRKIKIYVGAGDVIGKVGKTGFRGLQPHLHFQAYPDHNFRLNPYPKKMIDERGNPFKFLQRIIKAGGKLQVGYISYSNP